MTTDYGAVMKEVGADYMKLQKAAPDVMNGFGQIHHGVMQDGALSAKVKELMALCVAITTKCEGCITSHSRSAVKAGATPEEVAEMIGVAVLMGGGPGTIYGGKALAATESFR